MNDAELAPALTADATESLVRRRLKLGLRAAGWMAAALALITLFTVAKLPDDRIGATLLSMASQQLSASGTPIELTAAKTRISLLLLGRVRFLDVSLRVATPSGSVRTSHWKEARLSPSFVDLLLGRMGGSLRILSDDQSELDVAAWFKSSGNFALSLESHDFNLGDSGSGLLGLIPGAAGFQGRLPLSGKMELNGNLEQPSSILGQIHLKVGKTDLPQQKIAGMPFPEVHLSEGEIRVAVDAGTAKLESVRLGKMDLASDDLRLAASGSIKLAQSWPASGLDVSAKIQLSDAIKKSFFLLDAILGQGRQPDGSYSIALTGSLSAPNYAAGPAK